MSEHEVVTYVVPVSPALACVIEAHDESLNERWGPELADAWRRAVDRVACETIIGKVAK